MPGEIVARESDCPIYFGAEDGVVELVVYFKNLRRKVGALDVGILAGLRGWRGFRGRSLFWFLSHKRYFSKNRFRLLL